MACGCLRPSSSSGKPRRGSPTMPSSPQPPQIFAHHQRNLSQSIYTKLSDAIPPVVAGRDLATVNYHASQRSGGRPRDSQEFRRMSSTKLEQALEAGAFGGKDNMQRTASLDSQPSGGFRRMSSGSLHILPPRSAFAPTAELVKQDSVIVEEPSLHGAENRELMWTESRQSLEVAIHVEKAKDQAAAWNPDRESEESRLRKRLNKLNLDMKEIRGDGNCQFRAVSFCLYGSEEYHRGVRRAAVAYMQSHKEDYDAFLGESVDSYLESMAEDSTWGDELTLRAICDSYGIVINVVTSEQKNWFMRYKPHEMRHLIECFLTYIAPTHYNCVRRLNKVESLRRALSKRTSQREVAMAVKSAVSAEKEIEAIPESVSVAQERANGQVLASSL